MIYIILNNKVVPCIEITMDITNGTINENNRTTYYWIPPGRYAVPLYNTGVYDIERNAIGTKIYLIKEFPVSTSIIPFGIKFSTIQLPTYNTEEEARQHLRVERCEKCGHVL